MTIIGYGPVWLKDAGRLPGEFKYVLAEMPVVIQMRPDLSSPPRAEQKGTKVTGRVQGLSDDLEDQQLTLEIEDGRRLDFRHTKNGVINADGGFYSPSE